jgi:hypothetical protein
VVTKTMMRTASDRFFTDPRLGREALENHLAAIGPRDELMLGEYRVMASSGSSAGRASTSTIGRPGANARPARCGAASMMGVRPRFPRRRRMAQVAAPDAKHMTARGAAVDEDRSVRLDHPERLRSRSRRS